VTRVPPSGSSRRPARSTGRRLRAGFTLLEALVTLVLGGIVTAGVALALRTGLDASERIRERADAHVEARAALATLSADLSGAFLSGVNTTETLFVGQPAEMTVADQPFLSFTTLSYRRAARPDEVRALPRSDAVRVEYLLQPDPKAAAGPEGAPLLLARREQWLTETGPGETEVICGPVLAIRLGYSSAGAPAEGGAQDTWEAGPEPDPDLTVTEGEEPEHPPVSRSLPRGVEVTLLLAPQEGSRSPLPRIYKTFILIGAEGVPPFEPETVPAPGPGQPEGSGTTDER
jgi:prepilin-type N-terminal cleavage/methylation domain-containing protein